MNRNTLSAPIWFGLGLGLFVTVTHAQAPAAGQAGAQAPATQAPPPPGGGRGFTPGTESGFATFQTRCTGCHGNPAVERAPSPNAIREMTPERIYDSLTTGSMQTQSNGLTDAQKKALAEFMAGRPLGSARQGDGKSMPNQCTSNPTLANPAEGRGWNGWGNGLSNTRFQTAGAAGLTAAEVPRLKLKWAFGFPTGVSANAQPTVVAGRVFVGSDNGFFYSLDAKTGCVYWSFQQGSIVRNSPTVGAVTGQGAARYAVFFGDGHANVYALDAQTGRELWKTKVDPHFVARITAGITLLQRQGIRSSVIVRGVQQRTSRLPVLHGARKCGGARCEHRQGDLEVMGRTRRAEAVSHDAERRRALQARGRRGVEYTDRGSGSQRDLRRHR